MRLFHRFIQMGFCSTVLTLFISVHSLAANNISPIGDSPNNIEFYGDIWVFSAHHDNPIYNDEFRATFVETTARLGSRIQLSQNTKLNLRAVLGNVSGDSEDLTFVENETEILLDLWNLEFNNLFGAPLTLTVGRQNLQLGDGFVLWDGAVDRATVWTAEVRSMEGVKLEHKGSRLTTTLFSARTVRDVYVLDKFLNPHYGKSSLHGAHFSLQTKSRGLWELGFFSRHDDSIADADTTAISLRGVLPIANIPGLEFAGEVVHQRGHTRLNAGIPDRSTQDRRAWGGHFDLTYTFTESRYKPHITLREVYFSGDDPSTSAYEGYDPLFVGWADWGTWYVSSITVWEIFNTNTRVDVIEGGFHPSTTTKVRLQLFDFDLDREWTAGAGKQWSREANFILDWYYSPKKAFGLAVNYAWPENAAEAFVGDDNGRFEAMVWAILSF